MIPSEKVWNLVEAIVRDVLHRQPIGNEAIAKMAKMIDTALREAEARGRVRAAMEAWDKAITEAVNWWYNRRGVETISSCLNRHATQYLAELDQHDGDNDE